MLVITFLVSCSKPMPKQVKDDDPFPVKYENELFSVCLPKGWICDDSGWKGLDSIQNAVDFYNSNEDVVWFHFVKTYFPIQWKDIKEATEFAKAARALSGDNATLINEIDSAFISGYPTSVLMFANLVGNDTIIQKQFVTYIQETHTLVYFNENFLYHNWEKGQEIGDRLMENVVIKDVKNPIDEKFNALETKEGE